MQQSFIEVHLPDIYFIRNQLFLAEILNPVNP